MAIAIKVSRTNEVRSNWRGKDTRWGQEWCICERAARSSLLRFRSIRINCVDVAAKQSDDSLTVVGIAAHQVGHAIFIEIRRSQAQRFCVVLFKGRDQL